MMRPLGRRSPSDYGHVAKYALSELEAPPTHVPVAAGINWYTDFDKPVRHSDGSYWIGLNPARLGSWRGGHCICLEPESDPSRVGKEEDTLTFHRWYDQDGEGACVGFGCSRVMSLINRHRYDGFWLYDEARKLEGRYPDGEGAEVRSGLEVLRTKGHVAAASPAPRTCTRGEPDKPAALSQGIQAYRWARGVSEITDTLGTSKPYVVLLQSWGEEYPERVRMPLETLARLMREGGEAGVVTDR